MGSWAKREMIREVAAEAMEGLGERARVRRVVVVIAVSRSVS